MPTTRKSFSGSTIASLLAAGALLLSGIGAASAAELTADEKRVPRPDVERSLEAAKLQGDYDRLYVEADRLDVAPKRPATRSRAARAELGAELRELRELVREAERSAKREGREPEFGTPRSVGVSPGALEAIAACESGGDPSAVSAGGDYRGKYQFSYSTWASVGGSDDPAAASAAEQDYRAALLYARAGSSPWPICG